MLPQIVGEHVVDPGAVAGNTPIKISDHKSSEKAEKSISWADDGKSSNLIALAEVTLEVRPYYSPWGDVQAKWTDVARILGDRKSIPSGKNFRAVQGKMKDLLDTLSRYQEDTKKQNVVRCPFSEKLFRLLLMVQEQTTATPGTPVIIFFFFFFFDSSDISNEHAVQHLVRAASVARTGAALATRSSSVSCFIVRKDGEHSKRRQRWPTKRRRQSYGG